MDNITSFFIVSAKKENEEYYVSSISPIIWTKDIMNSKCFSDEETIKRSILKDYQNYISIKHLMNTSQIDSLFIIELNRGIEKRRIHII